MTAAAPVLRSVPEAVVPEALPEALPEAVVPEGVVRAERALWRAAGVGVAIAVPACALLWVGLVALALAAADPGWPYLPALGMAACVGAFAGMFFGGWAGVTLKAEELEVAERESHRRAR
jgi:hypothetical protein